MRFYVIFENPVGAGRRAIFINMDHVIEVTSEPNNQLIVHMSDGRTHVVEPDNEREFRAFPTALAPPR